MLAFVVCVIAFLATPRDRPMEPEGKVDFIGTYLGVAALFLFNFVWK